MQTKTLSMFSDVTSTSSTARMTSPVSSHIYTNKHTHRCARKTTKHNQTQHHQLTHTHHTTHAHTRTRTPHTPHQTPPTTPPHVQPPLCHCGKLRLCYRLIYSVSVL